MTTSAVRVTPRRSWLRRLAVLAACAVVLLIVAYFVVTSGAFFKSVILPKAGRAMNATIAVNDASISPFSAVTLRGLTVRTTGPEPVLSADEVRLRYSLRAMMGGTLKVDEVTVVNPQVRVIRNADGTSNLDPLSKPGSQPEAKDPAPSSPPPRVEIGRIAVVNGRIQVVEMQKDGSENRLDLERVNFALTDVRNGQTARLLIDGASKWYSGSSASNSSVEAVIKTDLNVGLTPRLELGFLKGGGSVEVNAATGGFRQLSGFRSALECDVTPTEFKQLAWRAFSGARPIAEMTVSGPFAMGTKEGVLDLTLSQLNLVDWQGFVPGLEPVGAISAKGRLTARDSGRSMSFDGQTSLRDFGATLGSNRLSQVGVELAVQGHLTNFNRVQLDRAEIAVTHQSEPAARLSASGRFDTDPQSADLRVSADLNLARLTRLQPQPEMQLSAGEVRLLDVRVVQEGNQQTVAGALHLTNVTGRVSGLDLKDLAVGASYEVSATDGKVVNLRQLLLHLAPTVRAPLNRAELAGRLDLTRTNALEGDLKLSAATLDLTPYYDLVAGQPATDGSKPPPPATSPSTSTNAPVEPAPIELPVKQLIVTAQIGQLWLREIQATQVVSTVKVERSRITVRPFGLAMNGAPLTADVDLDLSVPGWRYAVRGSASGLPIAPLADSFMPDYRGRAKGDLWADLKMDGAGVTGPNLRKSLLGNLSLTFTNADIQIVGPRLKGFLAPIALGLNAPGLLSSPLNWIGFGASLGSGKLNLSQLALVSPAFAAATRGEVTLGDTLKETRLGNWPMAFQLERSLADRLKLAPKDTPTNVSLVALPQFVTVAGTANDPKPKLDLQALAGAALLKYVDKIPGLDERTSGLLKGAAGLLSGSAGRSGSTNAPATNAPSGGLQDLFNRVRPK